MTAAHRCANDSRRYTEITPCIAHLFFHFGFYYSIVSGFLQEYFFDTIHQTKPPLMYSVGIFELI